MNAAAFRQHFGTVDVRVGDVFARLAELTDDSIDTVVTSPPYWGLRDYGVEGQIGLEPTLGEHIDVMVRVFAEIHRVLKPTGTVWLNYGDCYATQPNGRSAADQKADGSDDRTFRDKPFSTVGEVGGGHGGRLKPKDLCMIPNRLAIALQDFGWWVRSEIVWGKPNAMPDSSGRYRPSAAHEKIWLLTKSDDADVWVARDTGEVSFQPDLAERCPMITQPEKAAARWLRLGAHYDARAAKQGRAGDEDAATYRGGCYVGGAPGKRAVIGNKRVDKQSGHSRRHAGFNERWKKRGLTPRHEGQINHTGLASLSRGAGRLLRNYEPAPLTVWEMATVPFAGAHFATFPPELVERALKAGCPEGGLVLDPFGGAGTTGLVAMLTGRDAILIDLSETYAQMARNRIEAALSGPSRSRALLPARAEKPDEAQPALFEADGGAA